MDRGIERNARRSRKRMHSLLVVILLIGARPGRAGDRADRTAALAWNSAGVHPVEIRESVQTGRTVARFDQTSGLLDVSPTATLTYRLLGYGSGGWHDLAAATLTVTTTGCKN
jgi:hypothetical protein